MKRIYFFATQVDIIPLLEDFESKAKLKYVVIRTLETENRPIYRRASEIPQPGIATSPTGSTSQGYLVMPVQSDCIINVSCGHDGRKVFSANNSDNEESVVLTMAGEWKNMLLSGLVATVHDTASAQQLMRCFESALKKQKFQKIKGYWVGPDAFLKLQSGVRLSIASESSPSTYDLGLPAA